MTRTALRQAGVLCALFLAFSASADGNPAASRSRLTARLDSLEMEKQAVKRQGLPLDELEKASESVKDSLNLLKPALEAGDREPIDQPKAVERSGTRFSAILSLLPYKPAGMFDWAVIAVGAVAIVSAVVLLLNMLSGFTRKRKKNTPQQLPPSLSAYQSWNRAEIKPALPRDGQESIDALRTIVSGESSRPAPAAPPGLETLKDAGATDDIKRQVVLAAQEGVSPADIARKLHIGVDHVSLILKVAGKDDRNGR